MKQLHQLVALACLTLLSFACGEATTDEQLPTGTAPTEPAAVTDAQPRDKSYEPTDPTSTSPTDASETTEGDAPTDTPAQVPPFVADQPETGPGEDSLLESQRKTAPGITYQLPKGWTVGPPKTMRLLTLVPPAEFAGAELAVARWGNDVGGFVANVGRWAQQAGTDLPSVVRTDFPQINVGGTPSAYIPLVNKDTNKAILAVWVPMGPNPDKPAPTWTFKLTCSAEEAIKLEDALKAWARSIEFE